MTEDEQTKKSLINEITDLEIKLNNLKGKLKQLAEKPSLKEERRVFDHEACRSYEKPDKLGYDYGTCGEGTAYDQLVSWREQNDLSANGATIY